MENWCKKTQKIANVQWIFSDKKMGVGSKPGEIGPLREPRVRVGQIEEEAEALITGSDGEGRNREVARRGLDTLPRKTHYLLKTAK